MAKSMCNSYADVFMRCINSTDISVIFVTECFYPLMPFTVLPLIVLQAPGSLTAYQEDYPAQPRDRVRERIGGAIRAIPEAWHLPRLHTLRLGSLMLGKETMIAVGAASLPSLRELQLHGMHMCDGPLDLSPLLPLLTSPVGVLRHLGLNCGDASR